ncbi:MAG: D-lyxose/D-mannose family sugar isomerase [Candidatus Methylacidiphilales bacterium]|nr:D-lyxose/D-mannose family sugar isomerase [Candidatus Methylacidiphilales bacterium]
MKRSEINLVYRQASACFAAHHWALPPRPCWDITDFGLADFSRYGLTLINLATQAEYCEKLMYARRGQMTPCHTHARKKEDIICRSGALTLWLWAARPTPHSAASTSSESSAPAQEVPILVNGEPRTVTAGQPHTLRAGERITLVPGIWHAFAPASEECIIGEVSTANDDLHDNFFVDPNIGRFPGIEEDEPTEIRLLSE